MVLTAEQRSALSNYINSDINLHKELKLFFKRIVFLSLDADAKECCAGNEYFAKAFKKDPRTIRRWLKKLQDLKYITVELTRSGKMVIRRTIQIAQELLARIVKVAVQKVKPKKPHSKAMCPASVLYNIYNNIIQDTKKKKISKKEKVINKSKPKNYNELLKFWNDKNLQGNPRAFWLYNTKRAWTDIRSWKNAARGWDKKEQYNLALFKANKTKDQQPSTYAEELLPEMQSFSLDNMEWL